MQKPDPAEMMRRFGRLVKQTFHNLHRRFKVQLRWQKRGMVRKLTLLTAQVRNTAQAKPLQKVRSFVQTNRLAARLSSGLLVLVMFVVMFPVLSQGARIEVPAETSSMQTSSSESTTFAETEPTTTTYDFAADVAAQMNGLNRSGDDATDIDPTLQIPLRQTAATTAEPTTTAAPTTSAAPTTTAKATTKATTTARPTTKATTAAPTTAAPTTEASSSEVTSETTAVSETTTTVAAPDSTTATTPAPTTATAAPTAAPTPTPKPTPAPSNAVIAYTARELELFHHLIAAEASPSWGYNGQLMIAQTIVNRVRSGLWGSSLTSVIYARNQFSPVASGLFLSKYATTTQKQAVWDALHGATILPRKSYYFCTDYAYNRSSWFQSLPLNAKYGNTYFMG
ncbi:MAG: cell wall hydrolase [Clostridia bacterium]|nr:cell wall hydrolase [Clostridia bacterium]